MNNKQKQKNLKAHEYRFPSGEIKKKLNAKHSNSPPPLILNDMFEICLEQQQQGGGGGRKIYYQDLISMILIITIIIQFTYISKSHLRPHISHMKKSTS